MHCSLPGKHTTDNTCMLWFYDGVCLRKKFKILLYFCRRFLNFLSLQGIELHYYVFQKMLPLLYPKLLSLLYFSSNPLILWHPPINGTLNNIKKQVTIPLPLSQHLIALFFNSNLISQSVSVLIVPDLHEYKWWVSEFVAVNIKI